jgi:hypothetical protein
VSFPEKYVAARVVLDELELEVHKRICLPARPEG